MRKTLILLALSGLLGCGADSSAGTTASATAAGAASGSASGSSSVSSSVSSSGGGAATTAAGSSGSSSSGGRCGNSELLAGLQISVGLQLSSSSVSSGESLSGTATLYNPTSAAISLEAADIGARPPGGTDNGGPFGDDLYDGPAVTISAGQSFVLTGGRTFTATDPTGTWYAYVTVEDSTGTYHNSVCNVSFTVESATSNTTSTGSSGATSGGIATAGSGASSSSGSTSDSGTGSSTSSSGSSSGGGVGVPSAPSAVKAFLLAPGTEDAVVDFAAPSDNGGSQITEYTATSNPGGFTGSSKLSDFFNSSINGVNARIYIEGLTGGTAYTFTVTATNKNGTSAPSAASNSVTPAAYAPYYVYNGAQFSGGINPGWANYDFGGTFDYTSTPPAAPPTGYGAIALSQSGTNTGLQVYIQHVDPLKPSLTGQNNGNFDNAPFTYLSSYVYTTAAGQDFVSYMVTQVLFCGVATETNANAIVDSTQNWTPGVTVNFGGQGASWWNDTTGNWGGITAANTATTQPTPAGLGGASAGDYYEFGPADQLVGTELDSVAQYVTSPTAGTFTPNTWNLLKIPLTAYDSPGETNVSKGRILKFGMQLHGSGSAIYWAGLGFSR